MKNLYESILGDIDTTLNKSDETIEEMKKIHWLYSKSTDKVFKNIKGGIGMIFKKHFPKKLPRINVRWAYDPISVRPDDDHLFAYMTPNIEYLKENYNDFIQEIFTNITGTTYQFEYYTEDSNLFALIVGIIYLEDTFNFSLINSLILLILF